MIFFYRQFFMLHSKKSILQVKIQRLRNNCRHVRFLKPFLRWKLEKNLKRVQDGRWGLEFSHIQAQCSGESCCQMVGHKFKAACICINLAIFGCFCPWKPACASFGVFLKAQQADRCIGRPKGVPRQLDLALSGQCARRHPAQKI